MQILVVEPDAALGLFLKKGLTVEGHDVSWAACPQDALELVGSATPDLLVLDASSAEAKDLLKAAQDAYGRAAVLALIRTDTVDGRVECLDLGADDCISKPFSFQELTARCRALLRRQARMAEGEILLRQGTLVLNRINRSTAVDGVSVNLTVKEFRLLEYLLQNAGRCCSRTELLTKVFQLPPDNGSNVVDVYINYLRRKLTVEGGSSPQILTVRGAGYRLARAERSEATPIAIGSDRMHASA